jgi:hypothetical protein
MQPVCHQPQTSRTCSKALLSSSHTNHKPTFQGDKGSNSGNMFQSRSILYTLSSTPKLTTQTQDQREPPANPPTPPKGDDDDSSGVWDVCSLRYAGGVSQKTATEVDRFRHERLTDRRLAALSNDFLRIGHIMMTRIRYGHCSDDSNSMGQVCRAGDRSPLDQTGTDTNVTKSGFVRETTSEGTSSAEAQVPARQAT